MSTRFYVEDVGGARRITASDFPLAIGGPDAKFALPGLDAPEPVGYVGLSEGKLFARPGRVGPALVCNGAPVSTSRWLVPGDVLGIGDARIVLECDADATRLRVVTDGASKADTDRTAIAQSKITPIAFEPVSITAGRGTRFALRPAVIAFWITVAVLGVFAWFLFTTRSIEVRIEPPPKNVRFEGAIYAFEVGGRYLVRSGRYTLVAEKEGYRTLAVPVEVTSEENQMFHFDLQELPGRLAVETAVEGAVVWIDGHNAGPTPLDPVELPAGEHEVRIRSERYQEWSTRVRVERRGVAVVKAALVPRWASITFRSAPEGATLTVDGKRMGRTPITVDLLEGARAYQLERQGRKPLRGRVTVVATEAKTLPTMELAPVDGNLRLESSPSPANVSVDRVYRGQTPLELELSPEKTHEIGLSRAGYEPQSRTVRLESGASQTVHANLVARLGEIEIAADPPTAELVVNGEPRGEASQTLRLPEVEQRIEIKKKGYVPFTTTVTPRPGFPQRIEVALETEAHARAARRPPVLETAEGDALRLIGPRRFQMGASRREPGRRANEALREVEITRYFYLATKEVSNRQFRAFKPAHRSGAVRDSNLEGDAYPVVQVSWQEAAAYCNWLSAKDSLPPAYVEKDGKLVPVSPPNIGYRLPTEAEWARAARYPSGQSARKYPWGNALPVAPGSGNYADVSAKTLVPAILSGYTDPFPATAPVASFEPNPLGLYDLGGNVAEWVEDRYTVRPSGTAELALDPRGPEEGELHVIRGSSWMHGRVAELRLSFRDYGTKARPDVGFRIARYAESYGT